MSHALSCCLRLPQSGLHHYDQRLKYYYGFPPDIVGLTFIAVGLGMMAGVIHILLLFFIVFSTAEHDKKVSKMKPEDRLAIMMPEGLYTPIRLCICR